MADCGTTTLELWTIIDRSPQTTPRAQPRQRDVAIRDVRTLSGDQRRNLILRALAVGRDGLSRSIIIKATLAADYDAAAADAFERFGLAKELAAAIFLARQAERHGRHGAFLAGDASEGVLVFEDFGEDLPSLVQPLLHGSASDAEQALTACAIALARLRVETIDCQAEHAEIVRTAFPKASVPRPRGAGGLPLGDGWIDRFARTAPSLLGGTFPDREVKLLAERLERPGPWLVLVHGDPCPDNVLLSSNGAAELIDFEFATPGHALLDAAYWRMGFPTCWCAGRVPKAIGARIDRAYRTILAEAVPVAADDEVFRRESAIISIAWLFGSLAWLLERALREDEGWGISTLRSRILYYLETAIEIATEADILRDTRKVASAWLDELLTQWPSCSRLAPYPAFTTPLDSDGPTQL